MDYLVWELETGQQGTPHIQGYVRYKDRKRLSQVTQDFPLSHVETSKGSELQNRNYCLKDFLLRPETEHGEYGTYDPGRRQGRRTDLDEAVVTLQTRGLHAVAQEHPQAFVKYSVGLQKLHMELTPTPPLTRTIQVQILWGEPGVGKTWRVRHRYPDAFLVRPGRDYWGSYKTQEVIIFDEFNDSKWDIEQMNEWCAGYSVELDCRYYNKWAWWTKVFIISNLPPGNWWQYHEEVRKRAFQRRITSCIEVLNQEQQIDLI